MQKPSGLAPERRIRDRSAPSKNSHSWIYFHLLEVWMREHCYRMTVRERLRPYSDVAQSNLPVVSADHDDCQSGDHEQFVIIQVADGTAALTARLFRFQDRQFSVAQKSSKALVEGD
jgi:hypothetical protein